MAVKQQAPELSGLVAVKGKATPSADTVPRTAEPVASKSEPQVATETSDDERNDAPLNFRVSPAFRREFKTYAAQHDLKLNELLRLAFDTHRKAEAEKQKGV